MKDKYTGRDAIIITLDTRMPDSLLMATMIAQGMEIPTRQQLAQSGINLVHSYQGVNDKAYDFVNSAVAKINKRTNKGKPINLQSILD